MQSDIYQFSKDVIVLMSNMNFRSRVGKVTLNEEFTVFHLYILPNLRQM